MPIDAILLDIDGTLVDSNDFHVIAWQRAFEATGIQVDPGVIRRQIGQRPEVLIPASMPDLDAQLQKEIDDYHRKIFKKEFLGQILPFPCAYELVEALHREGREVVLTSAADQAEVDHYVQLLGIKSLLRATISSKDLAQSKPARDIFASALHKTSAKSAAASVVIGDTPHDLSAAAKSEIRAIALRSGGFSDEELLSAGPIAIYEDVSDLFVCLPLSALSDDA